jgi:dTDP-D-glucose 4,6-dehydratase
MLEHAFNVLPVIPNKTTYLFSELTFHYEGNTSIVEHISKNNYKFLKNKIIDLNLICRLFAITFQGRVKYWFESILDNSIHSLSEFVIEFLSKF